MKSNYFNILLISGSGIVAGGINYLYHPIMLKFLSLEEFGTFGTLVGIFNLLGVLLIGLDFFFTKRYSKKLKSPENLKFEYYFSLKILGYIGGIAYLLFILSSPILGNFLSIQDNLLFYITGLVLVIGFLGVNIGAMLKSLRSFHIISSQQLIAPIVKMLVGVVLVMYGFSIYGALLGFIISGIIPLLIGFVYVYKHLFPYTQNGNKLDLNKDLYKSKYEIFHFFLMSFIFAFFMNIDVILVKSIFTAELSGVYAAVSVLGKFLIFLLLSIETVYFGQIMEHEQKDTPKELIKNPLILITITCLGALIFNLFLGKYVLGFLKPELVQYTGIYMLTLIYYSLIAYVSFCIKVLTGWKYYTLLYILLAIATLGIILLYSINISSLGEYIMIFISMGICASIISISFLFFSYFKK